MNKIFKVIWSRTKNCYVTASELAKGHTKSASTGSKARRKLLTSAAALAMVLTFAGGGNAWASVTVNTTDPGTPATVYTTEEVDNALGEKANSTDVASTYATKTEVADTYATKTALTEGLAEKANSDDVANTYATKSELESGLDGKLDVSEDGDVSVSGDLDVTGAISGDSLDVDDGAISGGSLDVGDGTITGGAITGTSVSAGEGEISGGSLDVDTGSIGTVNIADNGDVTGVKDLTATGTLTGTSGVKDGTLTDGTYVLKESTVGENLNALDTQVDANADAITTETSARKTADTALVGAVNGGIVVGADNVLMKNTTTIEDGVVSNTQSAVDTLIMNQGAANQITLSQNGIKVGTNSSLMDENGVYTGGDNYTDAKAALNADGSIKGANGAFTVDTTGKVTAASGEIGGVKVDTDGDVTDVKDLTATGTITGGAVTDGVATLSEGSLTNAVDVTASGTITGGTVTDGEGASMTGGIVTGTTLTDGEGASMSNGTVTGTTLTDGVATLSGGDLTTTGDINAHDITSTGDLSTNNITATGITATSLNTQGGDISGGAITGTSVNVGSGSVSAGTGTFTGNVSADSMNVTNKVSAGSLETSGNATIGGTLTSNGITNTGSTTTTTLTVTNDASVGGDLAVTGDISGSSLDVGNGDISGGQIIGTGLDAGAGTIETTGAVEAGTLTTTGAASIGGNLTVEKDLTVDGEFNANTITSKLGLNNYTEIQGGNVTSVNSKLSIDDGITYTSTSTLTEKGKTETAANGTTRNVDRMDAAESSNVITNDSIGQTSTFRQRVDEILNQLNTSETTFSKVDQQVDTITNKVQDGENSTSTTQTAEHITNTAEQGTITNNAKALVNTASDTISNKAVNDITTTSTAGNISNTAENGTISNTAQNITNEASENMTNTIGENLTTTVGGDMSTEVTGNQTNTVTGTLTETVTQKATENYNGGLNTTVTGEELHTVNGNQTNTVDGNQTNTVTGTLTETVTQKATENYNGGLETNVTGEETHTVNGNQTNTVTGTLTETVTQKATENYNGGLETNVTGEESHTVNGSQINEITEDQTTTIGGNQTTTVTGDSSLTAGNIINEAKNKITNNAVDVETTASSSIVSKVSNDYGSNTSTQLSSQTEETMSQSDGKTASYLRGAAEEKSLLTDGSTKTTIDTIAGQTNTNITDGSNISNNLQKADQLASSVTDGTNTTVANQDAQSLASSITDGTKFNNTNSTVDKSEQLIKSSDTQYNASVKTATTTTERMVSGSIIDILKDADNGYINTTVTQGDNSTGVKQTSQDITQTAKQGTITNDAKNLVNTAEESMTNTAGTQIQDVVGNTTVTTTTEGTTFENADHNAAIGEGSITKTTISGNTLETGKATMDYAEVTKDLTVGGTTTTKDLHVTNNASVDGTLDVGGAANFQDSVTIAKDLSAGGNASIAGSVTAASYKVGNKTYIDDNGIHANNQKITNVAPGELSADSLDAVNGAQLYETNQRVASMDSRINEVGANAAAMANLHPLEFDADSKLNVAAAVGNYKNKTATALGLFYRPNEDVMFNVSGTVGSSDNMVGGGVAIRIGHGGNKARNKQMAENAAYVKGLESRVDKLQQQMDALLSVLNPNLSKDFPDVPENHWAYEAVSRLAGNGIIQGYEDGKYHGERTMTRYEMAEIIYKALSKGAEAEAELVEEFRPELQAMAAQNKA